MEVGTKIVNKKWQVATTCASIWPGLGRHEVKYKIIDTKWCPVQNKHQDVLALNTTNSPVLVEIEDLPIQKYSSEKKFLTLNVLLLLNPHKK